MKYRIFQLAVLIILSNFVINAQTVEEVIEKNLNARGGIKALSSITSSESKATSIAMGMEMKMKMFSKKPSKARVEMSVMGQNIISTFDGDKAYVSQGGQIMELPPEQSEKVKEQMKSQAGAYDNPLVDYIAKGNKVVINGREKVNDEECIILKITTKENKTMNLYISTKSWLDVKMRSKQEMPDGEKDVDIFFENNKKIDGILVPHKMRIVADDEEFASIEFEYIKFNVNLDDKIFKLK